MKRFLFILLNIFIFSLPIFAKDYIVAFAQDTLANDYRKAQVLATQKTLNKYPNIKFIYSDAKARTSMLIYQIDNFIKKKVDVLIIGTNDQNALTPCLQKAMKNHIPVIIVDRGVVTKAYTTFIHSDNIHIGKLGASYIAQKLQGKGVVLLLEGLQTADVTLLRTKGFLEVMAKYPKIKTIKATGNYLRRDAIIEVEKLLKKGMKFDAIFSQSDSMLSGAKSALEKYNIAPSSLISVSCDYTKEAQREILAKRQTASIKFPLAGKESAKAVIDILQGTPIAKDIVIPVKLVTQTNVREVQPIF